MFSKIVTTGFVLSFILILFVSGAEAQQPDSIAPQKRALIKEYLLVMHIKDNADQVLDAFLAQVEQDFPVVAEKLLQTYTDMSPDERELAERKIREATPRIIQRYKEELIRIGYVQLIEDISYRLYDKYYTEDELRDLITFFKTPTGQKTITITPALLAESMDIFREKMLPQARQIMSVIVREEVHRVMKEPDAHPTPTPRPVPHRRAARRNGNRA